MVCFFSGIIEKITAAFKKCIKNGFETLEVFEVDKQVRLIIEQQPPKNAWEFIQRIKDAHALPMSTEEIGKEPSNAEIKRWFEKKSIVINGQRPTKDDSIEWPVTQLIFHPKGNKKCTVI